MIQFLNKFKIPTILGLAVIVSGIGAGIFLVVREQMLTAQATPDLQPQNIIVTNIEDQSLTVSWQTAGSASAFLTYGQTKADEQVAVDDRDQNPPAGGPTPRSLHHVSLKNLEPNTTYKYRIMSGKIKSEIFEVTTAATSTNLNGAKPVIGSVLNGAEALEDGIVYLSIQGAITQSALIKSSGSFLIPLSSMRKKDLTDIFPTSGDQTAKITVLSDQGTANAVFKLQHFQTLPPIKLGQNVDLSFPSFDQINKLDLNKDGLINSSDYAIALKNQVDLNGDEVFNQKDLDLLQKQINQ